MEVSDCHNNPGVVIEEDGHIRVMVMQLLSTSTLTFQQLSCGSIIII